MKKYFLLLTMALVGAGSFTACSSDDDEPQLPGETKGYYVDATSNTTWSYFSLANGRLVGTGEETEADNATWFARKDWDIAINRYHVRTNSGSATSAGAQGGLITCDESVSFNSVSSLPTGTFAVDKPITSSGMGGETTVIKSDATVILFKKNADGSSVMPPVYLQAPVYIFRTADGASYYKVQFTQYKDENNATGHVKFNAAQIYQQ